MNTRILALLVAGTLAGSVIACTSSTEESAGSDNALSGSLADARGCAVRDTYLGAALADIGHISPEEFSRITGLAKPDQAIALGVLNVPSVGTVYLVEQISGIRFYSPDGFRLATFMNGTNIWYASLGPVLECTTAAPDAGPSSSPDGGAGDSGIASPTTCLSLAPIDQTVYAYTEAREATTTCTSQEMTAIASYYHAHATDPDPAAWRASVGADCASCAFGDASAATWAPLLFADGGELIVNRGGCVEKVSASYACGRTYQQFQDCLVDACLEDCTTQSDFAACRQDARVLNTSCRAALEAVTSACGGQDKVARYEQQCKGTAYTFEGPLKVACAR